MAEVAEEIAVPEVSGEPLGSPAPRIEGKAAKFKIGNTSTHSEVNHTPAEPAPAAEPAKPEKAAEPETTVDKPAPGPEAKAEPAPATSPKIGSSRKTPSQPATPEPSATPTPTKAEVFKAMGFDDEFVQFAEAYQAGDVTRFSQAMATDYNKMNDLQVLQESVRRAYPEATPEQLDILMQEEITDRYKLDPEVHDPEGKDAKAGKVRMELDAKRARTKLTEENAKQKLPTKNLTAEQQAAATQQQQARQQAEAELLGHPYTKSMLEGKKVTFGSLSITGQDGKVTTIPDFSVEIEDPAEVQRIMTDPKVYQSYITDENGKLDGEAVSQISAFAMNRKAFVQAMINYGKMLGKEELIEEKSNPAGAGQRRAPGTSQPQSLKEAFAKGRHGVAG